MDFVDQNNREYRESDEWKVVPRSGLGCVGNTGRRFLVAMNVIFMIAGILVAIAGVLLKTQDTALHAVSDVLLNGVKAATTSSGLTGTDLSTFDLAGIIDSAAVWCIAIGIVLSTVAVFGLYGVKTNKENVLITYASVIGLLIIAELAILIVLFKLRSRVDETLKAPLKDLINTQYAGFNGSDVVSVTYNFIMIKLSCCGIDGFQDFYRATKWINVIELNNNISVPLLTPVACCKPEVRMMNNYACAADPKSQNSNYRQGCYDSFWDEVYSHNTLIIICAIGVGVFELIIIFFACWVAHEIRINRKKKIRRPIQNSADIMQVDVSSAAEGGRDMPISVISTNRASTTGSHVSIRRDSNDSTRGFPDPSHRAPNTLSPFVEPPPYTSSPFLPRFAPSYMDIPMAQPGIPMAQPGIPAGSFTSFPFGTYGGQSQCYNRCSSMFQGHSECICRRGRSSSCCNQEQVNGGGCHHNDQPRNSFPCACEENEPSSQGQKHFPEKSFRSNDQLPPPYNGNQSVTSANSCSDSGYVTDNANTVNKNSSSKTNSNTIQKSPTQNAQFASEPRNNDVTSGNRHPVEMNQNGATDTQLSRIDDANAHQGALTPSQTCAVETDASSSATRGIQRKRALFSRRSISGQCTKSTKDDTSLPLRLRSKSFEEEFSS